MKSISTISFLVPAYNDQTTIVLAIREAAEVGEKIAETFEILVTDDGSSDETVKQLKQLTATTPQLHISVHAKNQGYGATMKELYCKGSGDWLFSIPGDYQVGAKEIFKLLPFTDKADLIVGWRKKRQDNWHRLLQSKLYNSLLHLFFGTNLHDVNSVRLMRSGILRQVKLTTNSAFVDAELTIKAKDAGFRLTEIPIVHRSRAGTVGGGGKWYIIRPVIVDMLRFALKRLI